MDAVDGSGEIQKGLNLQCGVPPKTGGRSSGSVST
jgi:hypothetical protein